MTNAPDIKQDVAAVAELLRAGRAGMALVVAERLDAALPELLAGRDHDLWERLLPAPASPPPRSGSDRARLQELCSSPEGRRHACAVLKLHEHDLVPLLDGRATLARTTWRRLWVSTTPRRVARR